MYEFEFHCLNEIANAPIPEGSNENDGTKERTYDDEKADNRLRKRPVETGQSGYIKGY